MLCKHCGNLVPENAVVCPQCGADATPRRRAQGVAGIRQGRQEAAPSEKPYSSAPYDDGPQLEDPQVISQRRMRGQAALDSERESTGRMKKRSAAAAQARPTTAWS